MKEINNELLRLIKEKKTINQISQELNLTNREVHGELTFLKKYATAFSSKYYYDGNLIYVLNQNKQDKISIITKPTDTEFIAICISDLHIGSELERLDLLDKVYEYCVKEGINIIINGGDLIDGFIGRCKKKHENHEKQIEYFIKNYPFDENILNFACLGNHDFTALYKSNIDFQEILKDTRPDIIPLGYGKGTINIKRDQIIVQHPLAFEKNTDFKIKNKLVLRGHQHQMKFLRTKNNAIIYLPTLSDILFNDNELPGVIKMRLTFENGLFSTGIFEYLTISDKIRTANEIHCSLSFRKKIRKNSQIPFEEEYNFSKVNKGRGVYTKK